MNMNFQNKILAKWVIISIFLLSVFLTSAQGVGFTSKSSIHLENDNFNQISHSKVKIDPLINAVISGQDVNEVNLVPDEIFIKYEDSDSEKIRFIEDRYNLRPISSYSDLGLILYHDTEFRSVHLLMNEPVIESVWGNHIEDLTSDPYFIKSAVARINTFVDFNKEVRASNLKNKGINGSSVTIAFLDTGVDITGQLQGGDLDDFDELDY